METLDTGALVRDLRVNEAQMRTRVAVAELARLAVQVREGLDPNLALLLRPDGQGGFTVISGHRRWLALMIAFIAVADLSAEPDLEGMQAVIEDICTIQDGFVILDEGLYEFLQEQVPETLSVPYRLWDGSKEDEILLLIKANSGAEEPDLVGQAIAYKAAVRAGVPYDQLAQVTGMPASRLKALVLLLTFPSIFQRLVNDGLLDLSIVLDLTGLQHVKIKALALALDARLHRDQKQLAEGESLQPYTNRTRAAITNMEVSPSVPARKDTDPPRFNLCSAVGTLWQKAIEEAPARFYHAIAARSLKGERVTGLNNQVELLVEIPELREHFDIEKNAWGDRVVVLGKRAIIALLPDPSPTCARCTFNDLPAERVKHELPFACRSGSAAGPCQYWTPKRTKFYLRTPWEWHMGGKVVKSAKELEAEWQKQYNREQSPRASDGLLSGPAVNVQVQRQNIRAYMTQHVDGRFDLIHPWATACARCAFHLDQSPIKSDSEAPHCQWAKGRRRLQFRAFVPLDVEGKDQSEGIIPFCLQYSPDREWAHIVPEAITPPPFSRGPMLLLVKRLAQSVNRNVYSTDCRAALQFLTGRPAKASDSHRQTFVARLAQEEAHLSNLQIWTLLQWLLFEWERVETGSSHQMVPAVEGYYEAHVTYFGQVMPGGVMEELWEED